MYWFKVNGVLSSDLKIIVTKMASSVSAVKNIETIEVPGRNGNLHIDNNCYKSKEITIECNLLDISKLDDVKALIDGMIEIELSTEPERIYDATVMNQIDFEIFAKNERVFPLQLELNPLSRGEKISTEINISSTHINVGGNAETLPIISIVGKGKVAINNKMFETTIDNLEVDCEMQECTLEGISANDKIVIDEFPVLYPGKNNISYYEGVTSLIISYNERWK